ncbi:MAG TPA: hydantoinase/oxoprolinase family protein [Vicinamibacterales bacterium]
MEQPVDQRAAAARPVRIGVDIGGTFTDLLLVNDATGEIFVGKTLTTPKDPSLAVAEETREALAATGTAAAGVQTVIHGTTLVTNAIIERKGATTALVTTKGFRDTLEIRREHRYEMYDIFIEAPKPLVPRWLRVEIDERVLHDGSVLRPLEIAQVEALARELKRKNVEAVAVSLLHAYANPAHERAIAQVFAEIAPEIETSFSSEVVPEIKEYERTSTTVCNVYVKRLIDRYLSELQRRLAALGLDGELYIMLSSGGIATVETSRRFPVRLLESGPAGGALASAHLGEMAGYPDLLSFDMGGTTAKLCIIEGGRPLTSTQFEVDRVYRFKKGSGLPVKIPVIDMIEIGAGGGSIARIDPLGLLKIGPESAGAEPGPACYGLGGAEPTVTDADLVLGYLDPTFFLGGRMSLDVEAARAAIKRRVADPLGISVSEAAWGIHRIVNENMANAARIHAVDRGKDPRAFPLVAFGGAGPVHAYGVAAILRSPAVISPLGAGVGSTIGFLTAPLAFDFVRSSVEPLATLDWTRVNALLREMEENGLALLAGSGLQPEEIVVTRSADLRYVGQGHEVRVPIPEGPLGPAAIPAIVAAFELVYRDLYGRVAEDIPIEGVNWRVAVRGPRPALNRRQRGGTPAGDARSALKGTRPVYFPEFGGFHQTDVYDRYRLGPGATFHGPAVVEERESTAVVGTSAVVSIDEHLNLVVRYDHAR